MQWRLDPGLSTTLDHVRWLAAFAVLLHHVRLHTIGSYGSDVVDAGHPLVRAFFLVTGLGHEAVICFFVLSGVLVAGKFVERGAPDARECGDYLIDRLSRIWIVAFPALLFSVALARASEHALGAFYHPSPGRCAPSLGDLAANLLFLHKAFFATLCSNGPYWSIHNEVWYYLTLPAIVLAFTASSVWRRGACLILLLAALGPLLLFDPFDPHNTLAHLPIWLAGMLVITGWRCRLPPTLGVALLVTALLVARAASDWHFLIRDYLVGLALLLLLLAIRDASPPAWLLVPGLMRLGRRLAGFSYSLYLTHAPVIFLTRTLLEEQLEVALPIRQVGPRSLAIMLFEVIAALVVAQLFYLAFERHTGALRAFLRAHWRGRGGAVVRRATGP